MFDSDAKKAIKDGFYLCLEQSGALDGWMAPGELGRFGRDSAKLFTARRLTL